MKKGSRVLLTGATGLVGRKVGRLLVEKGFDVVALTRMEPLQAQLLLPYPAHVIQWDGSGPLPPDLRVEGVIHLAGDSVAEGRWTEEKKRRIRDSRVRFSESLFSQLKNRGIQSVVSASAIGFYGDRGDEELYEASSMGEGFLAEVCRDWEKAVTDHSPVAPALVRIGIVLSREGGALPKMLAPFRWGAGGNINGGQAWMSWISLEDLSRLLVHVLENQIRGVVHAVAPQAVRNSEWTRTLSEVIGVPALAPVPGLALKALFGEMAQVLLASTRVRATNLPGFEFRHAQLQDVLKDECAAAAQGADEVYAEQWVDASVDKVFEFFSDEKNLERITPPFLNFSVLGKSTPQIEKGTLIDYQLKLYGIPFGWRTLIERWEPGVCFVDTQLKGPYQLWHHTHSFRPLGRGTLMTDRVLYRVPVGVLGRAAAGWKVRGDVSSIFKYRRQIVAEVFPARGG